MNAKARPASQSRSGTGAATIRCPTPAEAQPAVDDGKLLIVFVIAVVLVAAVIALVLWLIPQLADAAVTRATSPWWAEGCRATQSPARSTLTADHSRTTMPARIVTTHYRYKRPPRNRKVAPLEGPAIVTVTDRKLAKRRRAERRAEEAQRLIA